jgi:TetR/AcrR family transcriptional regulator, cholesterol catabolism regulator
MSSRTKTGRPANGGVRRELILDASVRLFHERGYDRTSVREIAEAVGIQKASLYYHFRSKEAILEAVHERFMDKLFARASERHAAGGAPDELLSGYITDLLTMMRNFRPYVEVFFRERYALTGAVWERVRDPRRRYESYIRDAITTGIEEGIFRSDIDPLVATYGIFGMCNWSYQWFDPAGRMSADEIADQFKEIEGDAGLVPKQRFCLDLDQPRLVEQLGGDDCTCWSNRTEDFSVRFGHRREVLGVRKEHARLDLIGHRCACLAQRGRDDLQAAARLQAGVTLGGPAAGP